MATNYHGGGSQSPTTISKPIERVFEDAQHTGEIFLSGRKLREYPKLAAKYDLVDTIHADVSKNRMSELPREICTYISMEKLNCYHNVFKSIPDAIVQLQSLTYLNLSRNQLSIIPSFISQLQALEVLIASHNRVVSLPEEIGVLDKLMELDVSCNEISHLPLQIGDLKSLKSLNVRRNLLQELPVEISKLNLRNLDISSNRISKIPTVFRRIETLEEIILDFNPLTLPPAHICTKGKQHIMKYLQIISVREEKARMGMLGVGDIEMKRFRKSLPPTQSSSSEEFRNIMDSPDKWKRHTVLSSDSGYSTTDSVDKCGWSPQEGGSMEPSHLIDSNNLAMRAAAAVFRDGRTTYTPPRETRREPPEPPQRINSRLSTEKPENQTSSSPPQTLTPGSSTKSAFSTPPTPPTLYRSNPQTPLTPPTPQGPGPGSGAGDTPNILGTSLEDEFTRELQRQKQEYENRKKIAEQLRIQQEEEDEREERRRAAQRIQDEQRALLDRQREEAEEAKRREEEKRLADEARKAAEEEAKKLEEVRKAEEARRLEEIRQQEEAQQRKTDTKKPGLTGSNSFKEERAPGSQGNQPYRRTVSDSNQRLPASSQPPNYTSHPTQISNGPIAEQVNGTSATMPTATTPTDKSPAPSLNNSFSSTQSTPPHLTNGPSDGRPKTPQGTTSRVATRTKPGERGPPTTSRVTKPGTTRTATTTKSSLPTSRKTSLNQDEELRKSTQSLKGSDTNKPKGDQRLRSIQKDANNYLNRRSSGSTSSEDGKRSTPTRSLAMQNTTSSSSSVSKRSGTVMTSAHVKMLDDYSKEANGPTYSRRETSQLMDQLRKTISTRLKRSLPDNLSEALCDGVLLCHLANQIRPRSVASVHVPSPAVPKLTPPKCRKNVENFLEACRKIGVPRDQICDSGDILSEKGLQRVAATVAALVAIATHSKHPVPSNV